MVDDGDSSGAGGRETDPVDRTDQSDSTPASPSGDVLPEDAQSGSDDSVRREVPVPMALYKRVTVFSTFLAIGLVVGGMIALDSATGRSRAAPEDVNLPVAILGLLAIVLGAAVYAFSTRFRAEGMGNAKDGDDEE